MSHHCTCMHEPVNLSIKDVMRTQGRHHEFEGGGINVLEGKTLKFEKRGGGCN